MDASAQNTAASQRERGPPPPFPPPLRPSHVDETKVVAVRFVHGVVVDKIASACDDRPLLVNFDALDVVRAMAKHDVRAAVDEVVGEAPQRRRGPPRPVWPPATVGPERGQEKIRLGR